MKTILWYDLETWGSNETTTRIAQFAAIRTDMQLNIVDEPLVYYCPPSADYLPSPHAVLVHKLLPNQLPKNQTVTELELLKIIQQYFQNTETTVAGYNCCRFDNQVLRFSWYRSAMEPYLLEFSNDKKWDLIDTIRTCYALRPDGFNWRALKNENNQDYTSFRLEHLATDNQLQQDKAHDALSDVIATIELAKLIQKNQPKLYDYLFAQRNKDDLLTLLKLDKKNTESELAMLVHVSGMISDNQKRAEVMVPIGFHPMYGNEVIGIALQQDVKQLLKLSVEEIRERTFSPKAVIDQKFDGKRMRLFTVRLKQVPALAPIEVLKDEQQWLRINHHKNLCLENLKWVQQNLEELKVKLCDVFTRKDEPSSLPEKDIDLSLYDIGFHTRQDKRLLGQFHYQNWQESHEEALLFENIKLQELCFRTRARNAPQTLSASEKKRWQSFCKLNQEKKISTNYSLDDCEKDIESLKGDNLSQDDLNLLLQFEQWLKERNKLFG